MSSVRIANCFALLLKSNELNLTLDIGIAANLTKATPSLQYAEGQLR